MLGPRNGEEKEGFLVLTVDSIHPSGKGEERKANNPTEGRKARGTQQPQSSFWGQGGIRFRCRKKPTSPPFCGGRKPLRGGEIPPNYLGKREGLLSRGGKKLSLPNCKGTTDFIGGGGLRIHDEGGLPLLEGLSPTP